MDPMRAANLAPLPTPNPPPSGGRGGARAAQVKALREQRPKAASQKRQAMAGAAAAPEQKRNRHGVAIPRWRRAPQQVPASAHALATGGAEYFRLKVGR